MNALHEPILSGTWSGGFRRLCLCGLVLFLALTPGCGPEEQSRSIRLPSQKPAAESSEVGIGDLYAIVVGVANYNHPKIPKLKFSDKDARDFADFLKSQKQLFRYIHLTLLLNEQATQKEVKRHLFYELPRAGKNDSVVLFLAGHGADDPKMPGEFFFLTYDADPAVLEGTAVNMGRSWFMQRLDSKRVLVIADTCHAGGFASEGARGSELALRKLMNQFQESEGRVFLTSSRPDEISREEASLGNGVFTYHLLEGLKGKASRSGDGVVTLQDAYEYVYEKTKNATKGMQHPQMEGKVVGKFPMSLVRLEPSPSPIPQYSGQPTTGQVQPSELDSLRSQAEKGDAKAQFELGLKYEYGLGVIRDKAEAMKWYFKASEKDDGDARAALARLMPPSVVTSVAAPTASKPAASKPLETVKPDTSKDWPLIEAARAGQVNDVRYLISKGVDVNARRAVDGWTALISAAMQGHSTVVKVLLENGADVHARDIIGRTGLAWAAKMGHIEIVELLLEKGADIEAKDKFGETALIHAVWEGYTAVVNLLLEKGADVNAKGAGGYSALRIASFSWRRVNADIVNLLKKKGAWE